MNARPRRVWVTRTLPQARVTAERLMAMGLEAVVAPVLEARPIVGASIDLAGVDALAFTSSHAIRAFVALSPERALPVFTVGDATGRDAAAAGFASVASAGGDASALADLIVGAEPRPRRLLIPVARAPAADLVMRLADRGVAAGSIAVYETAPTNVIPPLEDIDAVLVHSPRAGALVASLVGSAEAGRIDGFAISQNAAAPLRAMGLRSLYVAAAPTEDALLALIAASRARKGLGAAFWSMIAFGMACIIAGVVVARFGPALFPAKPRTHAAAPQLGKPPGHR